MSNLLWLKLRIRALRTAITISSSLKSRTWLRLTIAFFVLFCWSSATLLDAPSIKLTRLNTAATLVRGNAIQENAAPIVSRVSMNPTPTKVGQAITITAAATDDVTVAAVSFLVEGAPLTWIVDQYTTGSSFGFELAKQTLLETSEPRTTYFYRVFSHDTQPAQNIFNIASPDRTPSANAVLPWINTVCSLLGTLSSLLFFHISNKRLQAEYVLKRLETELKLKEMELRIRQLEQELAQSRAAPRIWLPDAT